MPSAPGQTRVRHDTRLRSASWPPPCRYACRCSPCCLHGCYRTHSDNTGKPRLSGGCPPPLAFASLSLAGARVENSLATSPEDAKHAGIALNVNPGNPAPFPPYPPNPRIHTLFNQTMVCRMYPKGTTAWMQEVEQRREQLPRLRALRNISN